MRKHLMGGCGLGLLLSFVAVIWAGENGSAPAARLAGKTATPNLPTGEPAICLWDGGIYMLGIKPYVVFAVWKDGTVLRRDEGQAAEPGKLRIGRADPAAVARLLADCDAAGFYDPPVRHAVLVDGPERRICLRDGTRRQILAYHDRDEWVQLDALDPATSWLCPGRYEMARFVRLWRQASAGIDALKPAGLIEYVGPVLLEYPAFGDELTRRAGAIGSLPASGPDRTAALIAELKADAPATRCAAAEALEKFPDPNAIEPLMSVLDDPYLDSRVFHLAASALWKIGEPAIPRLAQGLKDEKPVIRRRCAEVLGLIISDKGVEPLMAALEDRDPSVHREVIRALSNRQAEQAAPKLAAALADNATEVRAAAAGALGRMSVEAARPALVARLASDREAQVRANAALGLKGIVDDKARAALVTAMKTDPDGGVRSAALTVLADQPGVGDLMLAALRDKDSSVRKTAVEFLGKHGDQRAIEPLLAALTDSQYDVKVASAQALGRIGDLRAAKALEALVPRDKSKVYYFEKVAGQAAKSIRTRVGEKSRNDAR